MLYVPYRYHWADQVEGNEVGKERKVYKVLVARPEEKRALGKPRHEWEDGIRMDLREIGWGMWSGFSWLRRGTDDRIL
jgi:hypothetical protein